MRPQEVPLKRRCNNYLLKKTKSDRIHRIDKIRQLRRWKKSLPTRRYLDDLLDPAKKLFPRPNEMAPEYSSSILPFVKGDRGGFYLRVYSSAYAFFSRFFTKAAATRPAIHPSPIALATCQGGPQISPAA